MNRIKFIYLLLLIIGCSNSLEEGKTSSQKKSPQRKMVTGKNLFGVEAHGSDLAWVVGFEGTILHTSDGGLNWTRQKGPDNAELYDAFFIDAQNGWIVGKFGTILHTKDGGENWEKQETATKERLFDIHFIDSQTGWAVGTMGTILHTNDGGKSWVEQGFGEDRYYNGVFFVDAQRGWVTGEYSLIYHTEDGGKNWKLQECEEIIPEEPEDDFPPPPPHLYGVYFNTPDIGWITGMDGIIIKTEDGGKTWKKLPTGIDSSTIYKVVIAGDKGWAVGEKGSYVISIDGGNNWKLQTDAIKSRFWLRDIDFTDAQHGWIVGAYGIIVNTDNGGDQWEEISGIFIRWAEEPFK